MKQELEEEIEFGIEQVQDAKKRCRKHGATARNPFARAGQRGWKESVVSQVVGISS